MSAAGAVAEAEERTVSLRNSDVRAARVDPSQAIGCPLVAD
jgi:hypothetical protein